MKQKLLVIFVVKPIAYLNTRQALQNSPHFLFQKEVCQHICPLNVNVWNLSTHFTITGLYTHLIRPTECEVVPPSMSTTERFAWSLSERLLWEIWICHIRDE